MRVSDVSVALDDVLLVGLFTLDVTPPRLGRLGKWSLISPAAGIPERLTRELDPMVAVVNVAMRAGSSRWTGPGRMVTWPNVGETGALDIIGTGALTGQVEGEGVF